MSRKIVVEYSRINDSGAALGRTGNGHCVIADRPVGVAEGTGLGFNGAELLAASLGGCFWNDLHYAAAAEETKIVILSVTARVDLAGEPLRVVRAHIIAKLGNDDAAHRRVFDAARAGSTIANSLCAAFPVIFEFEGFAFRKTAK